MWSERLWSAWFRLRLCLYRFVSWRGISSTNHRSSSIVKGVGEERDSWRKDGEARVKNWDAGIKIRVKNWIVITPQWNAKQNESQRRWQSRR